MREAGGWMGREGGGVREEGGWTARDRGGGKGGRQRVKGFKGKRQEWNESLRVPRH